MKNLIAVGIVSLLATCASARMSTLRIDSIKQTNLLKSIQHQSPEYSIAKVYFSPAEPRQGDKVTTFIELQTDFESHKDVRSIVMLKINGQNVKTVFRNGTLWTSESFMLSGQDLQNFEVSLYIENINASERARASLLSIKKEIQQLNIKIAQEIDPIRKTHLEDLRDQKIGQKTDLEALLESLKRVVAVKSVDLTTNPGNPSPTLPEIKEVDPAIGQISGNELLVVTGQNLAGITKVSIGGVEIPSNDYTLTGTTIEFVAPALAAGMHEILIEASVNGQTVTSRIKNAFYVLTQVPPTGPVFPVAFAGIPQTTLADVSVQLDGSQSYSANGDSLAYLWSVVSKPEGATSLDGIIDQPTSVNPSFLASAPGNYVVSLVVSNSEKSSVPSLTVITVGAKDPVTITPTQISGVAQKDGVYIGSFKACNNLQTELPYQIFNSTRIVFVSGMRRGVLTRGNCAHFQFSVNVQSSQDALSEDIPFLVRGTTSFKKIIHLEVQPAEESNLSLELAYPSAQWHGERDIERISLNGLVSLYGTSDEVTSTPITVINSGTQPIVISNSPIITHLNGSSGIFSTDFPSSGVTIPASGSFTLNILVSPGSFGSSDAAFGIFEWDTGSLLEGSKIAMLTTNKLREVGASSISISMGTVEVGQVLSPMSFSIPTMFFPGGWFKGLSQIESINTTENSGGVFSLDKSEFIGPTMFGSVDSLRFSHIDIYPSFTNTTAGNFLGKFEVKLKGYVTPIEMTITAAFTEPETP